MINQTASNGERRRRLSDKQSSTMPWIRAEQQTECFLYWLPVSEFPVTHDELQWLQSFYLRFADALRERVGLRAEAFLQLKMFTDRRSSTLKRYRDTCSMLMGLSRAPGAPMPEMPTAADFQRLAAAGTPVRIEDSIGDYCYWLEGRTFPDHIGTFLGGGGFLTLFMKPDPKVAPASLRLTPKLRAAIPLPSGMDLDAMLASATRMREDFLLRSKILFGEGLEQRPEYRGIQYIIPLLSTGDFFAASEGLKADWFSLFDCYLNESPSDGGILMAFRDDLEPLLVDVLEAMRSDGCEYPSLHGKSRRI